MYRLLIADDEIVDRLGLERMIHDLFPGTFYISTVGSAAGLVSAAREEKPDILVVDINMPSLSGLEAIRLLSLEEGLGKVILHTAYSDTAYLRSAIELGVFGYLLKPTDIQQLQSLLQKALRELAEERRQREREQGSMGQLLAMRRAAGQEVMSSILLGTPDEESFAAWSGGRALSSGGLLVILKSRDTSWYAGLKERAEMRSDMCPSLSKVYQGCLYLYLMPSSRVGEATGVGRRLCAAPA